MADDPNCEGLPIPPVDAEDWCFCTQGPDLNSPFDFTDPSSVSFPSIHPSMQESSRRRHCETLFPVSPSRNAPIQVPQLSQTNSTLFSLRLDSSVHGCDRQLRRDDERPFRRSASPAFVLRRICPDGDPGNEVRPWIGLGRIHALLVFVLCFSVNLFFFPFGFAFP